MSAKLDKLETLLDSGFTADSITSDGTLDVTLRSGQMEITIRFDRDEVAEIWPRLFGDDVPLTRVVAGTPRPTPYGLAEVVEMWERDRKKR